MAISKVSTAEFVFHGAAEAPRGAGGRAAGDSAGRAALREQLARLEATTGLDAQAEARARAIHKAQLWTVLSEHLTGNPALVLAVMELEHLDEVSLSFLHFLARRGSIVLSNFLISGRGLSHARGRAWSPGRLHPQRPWVGG